MANNLSNLVVDNVVTSSGRTLPFDDVTELSQSTVSQNQILNGYVFPENLSINATNGLTVPVGVTHLRTSVSDLYRILDLSYRNTSVLTEGVLTLDLVNLTATVGSDNYILQKVSEIVPWGVRPDGLDSDAINAAALVAATLHVPLNLTGGVDNFTIDKEIDLTNVKTIFCEFYRQLRVTVDASYATNFPNGYAVLIGNTVGDQENGRASGARILGNMVVSCNTRTYPLHGVYCKGSWIHLDCLRVHYFNGHGFAGEAIWDSYFGKISLESCGRPSAGSVINGAAFWLAGADSNNTTKFSSIQCETAYQYGFYVHGNLRQQIENIHCERLYLIDGTDYSHLFVGSNTTFGQALFNKHGGTTTPEGDPLDTVNSMRMLYNMSTTSAGAWAVGGDIYRTFGDTTPSTFDVLQCVAYIHSNSGFGLKIGSLSCVSASLFYYDIVDSGNIDDLTFGFDSHSCQVSRSSINNSILVPNNIRGDLDLFNCVISGTVSGTKSPTGGRRPLTFRDCTFNGDVVGGFQEKAVLIDCNFADIALVSRAILDIRGGVLNGSFSYSGNMATITNGLRLAQNGTAAITSWKEPDFFGNVQFDWPSGTTTQRPVYSAGANHYTSTGSAWNADY